MRIRSIASPLLLIAASTSPATAEWSPDWINQVPVGSALSAGLSDMAVAPDGTTFLTGINGSSSNTNMITVAFAPDGSLQWQHVYNGPADWHDQARAMTLAPNGRLYVTGNTPGPGNYANVSLLTYSAQSGALLTELQYSSAPFTSEHGGTVAVDANSNVFIGGGTVGDGGDGLMLGIDPFGQVSWQHVYDGPAFGPFSQDNIEQVKVAPDGGVIAMIHGVMNSLHPDFVIIKYAPGTGSIIWQTNWGVSGGDFVTDMEIDANGDIYVTGTGLDFTAKYSTIKLRGTDGQLLWQAYDSAGFDDRPKALALDGAGGVYVTGQSDPDGDNSNFNDDFYTVKRDANTGEQIWTHQYGDGCVGCFDDPSDVIVDSDGNVLVVGGTSSPPYSNVMVLFRLDSQSGLETDRSIVGGGPNEIAGGSFLKLDSDENIYIGGGYANANTGAEGIAVFRYESLIAPPPPLADGNLDGRVDVDDLVMVLLHWGETNSPLDFNGDGIVDVDDLIIVILNWTN